jgi:hypothetical protein
MVPEGTCSLVDPAFSLLKLHASHFNDIQKKITSYSLSNFATHPPPGAI